MPATVTSGGMTENYAYDADGERVAKTMGIMIDNFSLNLLTSAIVAPRE